MNNRIAQAVVAGAVIALGFAACTESSLQTKVIAHVSPLVATVGVPVDSTAQ